MRNVIAFPLHRVARSRAPLENKVLPFVQPEPRPYAELEFAMLRVGIAFAELAIAAALLPLSPYRSRP